LSACQNEGRWYPAAEVAVASRYEYTDQTSGTKALQITFIIHNTSDASISSSTLTVKVITTNHEYLQTLGSNLTINSGGNIALSATVSYLEADEALKPEGILLYDSFFN
jgi:HKD family nuclease